MTAAIILESWNSRNIGGAVQHGTIAILHAQAKLVHLRVRNVSRSKRCNIGRTKRRATFMRLGSLVLGLKHLSDVLMWAILNLVSPVSAHLFSYAQVLWRSSLRSRHQYSSSLSNLRLCSLSTVYLGSLVKALVCERIEGLCTLSFLVFAIV